MSDFWVSIINFFEVGFEKPPEIIYKFNKNFINSSWFTNSEISYSKNVFKNDNLTSPAIKYQDESGTYIEISWNSLKNKTLEFQNSKNGQVSQNLDSPEINSMETADSL